MDGEEESFGEPEYLGWSILRQLKQLSGDQISRSKFLKLCCIADRRLLEEYDYDVGLPRYWYMYGELGSEHEFSGRFYNAPQAIGWEGQQYIPKELDVEDFAVADEERALIDRVVGKVAAEFGRENVETIKQHQYEEYAENEFIREYSEVRWLLSTVDLGKQARFHNYTEKGETNEDYLRRRLDEMLDAYPDGGRYDGMKSLYLRWDDTVRLMLDQSIEYSRIAEFLDRFIEALSKVVLRFEYNQHIPDERIERWGDDAAEEKAGFASEIREVRRELLDERPRSNELDGVSEAYSEAVGGNIERLLGRE